MKFKGLDCILLIDDDVATNFINKKVVNRADIEAEIKVVQSGEEALQYLSSTGPYLGLQNPMPGLILLDINMPVMNGWEFLDTFLQEVKAAQQAKIKVIMLTSSVNPEDTAKAERREEVAGILSKPLQVQDLKKVIVENFAVL